MVLKVFFATDIHGSETCYRKFLNALKIYKVDVGILAGDLTGKTVVPIIEQPDGTYVCSFLGQKIVVKSEEELRDLERKIATIGSYYYYTTQEDIEKLREKSETVVAKVDEKIRDIIMASDEFEKVFTKLACERLEHWLELAEERLKNTGIKMYICPGNDDTYEIDKVLMKSTYAIYTNERKVDVDGHEMISLAASNPTPWDTPREMPEEKLAEKIEALASQIENMGSAIFNFHVPPYGTLLDVCPKLSEDLTPSVSETINAGSTAVLEAIKKYQPLLGLHGHIHESRGLQKIGRTVCVNPGSDYTEGILRGVILILDKKKVKSYMFTSG